MSSAKIAVFGGIGQVFVGKSRHKKKAGLAARFSFERESLNRLKNTTNGIHHQAYFFLSDVLNHSYCHLLQCLVVGIDVHGSATILPVEFITLGFDVT